MVGIIFGLLGGLALFVFAIKSMGDGLQKMVGKKTQRVMEMLTSIPVVGVLVGTAVTFVTQSSTLVTVMVVGFVNASMMTLKQAISVIMGANIGTTFTAQLIAFRITYAWPFLAALGFIFYFFFKQKRIKTAGFVVFSLGILLLGMVLMSQAVYPLRQNESFHQLMLFLSDYALLALLVGAAFTALVQSSTAATGVILAMTMEGLIPLEAALPLILGTNIGTCVTAVLASLGASLSARRAALSHVMFNVLGALIFLIFLAQFEFLVLLVSPEGDLTRQVANAHTLFSVISTLFFLPLITPFTKLIEKMLPGKENGLVNGPIYLDWNMVGTPHVAINLAREELLRMADIAGDNVQLAMEGFLERDEKKIRKMREQEALVDDLEKEISRYLAKVSQFGMDDSMSILHTGLLHAANDIERISDHAENIADLTDTVLEEDIEFAEDALEELREMYELTRETYQTAVRSVREGSRDLAEEVKALEAQIDAREETLRASHIRRLKEGRCTAESGVVYLDIISNFERIGDHSNNVSEAPRGNL